MKGRVLCGFQVFLCALSSEQLSTTTDALFGEDEDEAGEWTGGRWKGEVEKMRSKAVRQARQRALSLCLQAALIIFSRGSLPRNNVAVSCDSDSDSASDSDSGNGNGEVRRAERASRRDDWGLSVSSSRASVFICPWT